MRFFIFFVFIFFVACSSKTSEELKIDAPKMILENMRIEKYENAKKRFLIQSSLLENYPMKKIIAIKNLYMVQYKENFQTDSSSNDFERENFELKVSTKLALLKQEENQFFLGDDVFLKTAKNKMSVWTKNLFYDKNENMIYAGENELVRIKDESGTEITGKNFVANTLSQEFSFLGNIEGSSNSSIDEEKNKNERK